jgi:hypothetical protein
MRRRNITRYIPRLPGKQYGTEKSTTWNSDVDQDLFSMHFFTIVAGLKRTLHAVPDVGGSQGRHRSLLRRPGKFV